MPFKEIVSLLSIAAGYASAIPYIVGIVKGTTKPHMISWLIWAVASGTVGTAQYVSGGGVGSWFLLLNAFYCLGIAIASIWRGTKNVRRSDFVVLAIAMSAWPLWWVTRNPLLSVMIATAIDAIGYVPMVRKSWTDPYEEAVATWGLSSLVFALSMLALETYSTVTCLYPATFALINAAFFFFLLERRLVTRRRLGESQV